MPRAYAAGGLGLAMTTFAASIRHLSPPRCLTCVMAGTLGAFIGAVPALAQQWRPSSGAFVSVPAYAAAPASRQLAVTLVPTTLQIAPVGSAPAGEAMAVTYSLTGQAQGQPLTGTVTIGDGVTSCAVPAAAVGVCGFTYESSGPRTFTATYSGSDLHAPSVAQPVEGIVGPRRYTLAEGVTGPRFDTYLLLANPGLADAPVRVTFLFEDHDPISVTRSVPARSRETLRVDDIPGLEATTFSMLAESLSGAVLAVERAVYFDMSVGGRPTAGHVGAAVAGSNLHMGTFLAEGSNAGSFHTYLLFANPTDGPAFRTVQFTREGVPRVLLAVRVPPRRRVTLDTRAVPGLAGHNFGLYMFPNGPVAVERVQYLDDSFRGGHAAGELEAELGATQPTRYFAEGATIGGFSTYLLLHTLSPGNVQTVPVTFHTAAGHVFTRAIDVTSRTTINLGALDARLSGTTFWFEVPTSVRAERAMYWPGPSLEQWTDGHASAGAFPQTRQLFAEGVTGGAWNAETYLLLANPGVTDAVATVTYLRSAAGPVTRTYVVPAGQRVTVGVHDDPDLASASFGMDVDSTTPIVAERSIYWRLGAGMRVGGTNEVGQRYR